MWENSISNAESHSSDPNPLRVLLSAGLILAIYDYFDIFINLLGNISFGLTEKTERITET